MDQRYGTEVWNGSFKEVWNGGMERGYGTGVVPELVPDLLFWLAPIYIYLHECVWCIHRVTGCPRPPFAKSSACSLQILYSGNINMIVYWRFRQHIRTLHFEVTNSTNSRVKWGLHCIIDSRLRSAKCCMSNAQGMYMPVPDKVFFIATFQHVKSEKTAETFCKHNFHVVSTLIE